MSTRNTPIRLRNAWHRRAAWDCLRSGVVVARELGLSFVHVYSRVGRAIVFVRTLMGPRTSPIRAVLGEVGL